MAHYEWQTQLGPYVLEHWRTHADPECQERYKALVKAKVVEKAADKAALEAIDLTLDAMTKHKDKLSYEKIEEMAFTKWDRPPALPPKKPATGVGKDKGSLDQLGLGPLTIKTL
jgi:hypothetical protein